ncbi:MAG TPA: cation diffusion facilitator family transporter, partial [Thermoanaerobaculia bacterium]|nr:cation diffusion facilitator family transporter [Thermoanaerobaculia bacterium]
LTRFAWLSIAAAVATIALKSAAYLLTGSVGLLSDAIESLVNLCSAIVALVMLTIAARPADERHLYGHSKAEYFSSGAEGALILIAAASILVAAIRRFVHPRAIEQVGIGLAVSAVAAAINFAVAWRLRAAAREHNSITLEADSQHLMTDVWTSAGVIAAVGLVAATGWRRIDPAIAIAVAVNIVWSGYRLIHRSVLGLMDTALPADERQRIVDVLDRYRQEGIDFHALRTRQAAARRFVSVHVLVPGAWTVQEGHRWLERIEAEIRAALPDVTVFTHLEPIEDPASFRDVDLDRDAH